MSPIPGAPPENTVFLTFQAFIARAAHIGTANDCGYSELDCRGLPEDFNAMWVGMWGADLPQGYAQFLDTCS